MRILYVLTLIKYVYDLEHHGDYSIAGIIFRNIKIVDDIMALDFCAMQQKDYSQKSQNFKVDFGSLEGMSFFVDYVLEKPEAKVFIDVLRALLSRSSKGVVRQQVCSLIKSKKLRKDDLNTIEELYTKKYGSSIQCTNAKGLSATDALPVLATKKPNLFMHIEKDNPIFLKDYCYNKKRIVVKVDSSNGRKAVEAFRSMQSNYKNNIRNIEGIMDRLVVKQGNAGEYELRDITKPELDDIVQSVKSCVKIFYIQSIADYQHLLDIVKNNNNIELNKES
jgi:hypothetical protein